MEREDGILLQRHGENGETRGHWKTDEGGGRWLQFVGWWKYEGQWSWRKEDQISQIALAELARLLPTSTGANQLRLEGVDALYRAAHGGWQAGGASGDWIGEFEDSYRAVKAAIIP